MPGVLSGGLCKAPAQRLRGRAMCVFLQPDHSIPHLEPFLAASLPHSSCSSSSRPGTYSLQTRRASLHMPASCKHDGRNAHRLTRTPALLAPRNTSGLSCHLAREPTGRNNHSSTSQLFPPQTAPMSIHSPAPPEWRVPVHPSCLCGTGTYSLQMHPLTLP